MRGRHRDKNLGETPRSERDRGVTEVAQEEGDTHGQGNVDFWTFFYY